MTVFRRIVTFLLLAGGGAHAESPGQSSPHFVAFRFDDSRVIAVVKVLDDGSVRRTEAGLSTGPVAQFGFAYFDAPDSLRAHVPLALQSAPWIVHTGRGRALSARVEKVVGGNPQCQQAAAVLLAIDPSQLGAFTSVPQHYFVAEPQAKPRPDGAAGQSKVGELPSQVLTAGQRRALESLLDDVLMREWPAIRKETEAEITRMATSEVDYHRKWAAERRRLDQELSRGRVKRSYDVQGFHLDPSGAPTYYVRAEWLAGGRQTFAATLWLQGDKIVETNVGPASWLRMHEFQNKVGRLQLGLVLNVLDVDDDGWGEVIFAHGGYESLSIEVREYSPDGFLPPSASYTSGC